MGATVLDGATVLRLLAGRSEASVSVPLELAREGGPASVQLRLAWRRTETMPGESRAGADIGNTSGDTSDACAVSRVPGAASSLRFRPQTGFLIVKVLHASQLPLPRRHRRLSVRESSRLTPFVQIRFAGATRWSSRSRGCSPNFDERIEFADVTASPGDYIDVSVRHGSGAAAPRRSVQLGYVRVGFDAVLRASPSGLKSTWTLREGISGSISLRFVWVPVRAA